MLSRIYGGWFREIIRETLAEPMRKEQSRIKREMDIYRKPVAINYDKQITDQDIERAKMVDCAELLKVKKMGKRNWAICPFHDDHSPSLLCYEPPKGYNCFVCLANGSSIDLVMKLNNLSFIEAVRFLNRY